MAEVEQDIRPPDTPIDSTYRRWLAVVIALVAVLAGAAAAASAFDDSRADMAHRDAQRLSISGMAESAVGLSRFHDERSRQSLRTGAIVRQELDRTADVALGRRLGAPFDVADGLDRLAPTAPEPELQTSYQDRFQRAVSRLTPGTEMYYRAQAGKEVAESWSSKSDDYFMVVTLLAVVLTLLGLASTIGGHYRRWFHWPAAVIIVVAAVVAGQAHLTRVTSTPDEAVQAMADGDALLPVHDYRGAVARYDRAIALRPDYAAAWRARGSAVVASRSVGAQVNTGLIGDSSPEAYREGVHDLEQASELGLDDPGTLGLLGAFRFHLGDFAAALDLTEQAIEKGGPTAVAVGNVGLLHTAQGHPEEAAAAYRLFVEIVSPLGRADYRVAAEQYGVAITALEKVVTLAPERGDLARRMQDVLVSAWAASLGSTAPADPDADARLFLAGEPVRLRVRLQPSELDRDAPVSLVASYRPDGSPSWAVRADLSVVGKSWAANPSAPWEVVIPDGFCLGAGTFRVDAFTGDRRLATAEARSYAAGEENTGFVETQSGVRGCRPREWTPVRETFGVAAYRGPDGAEMEVRSLPLDVVGPIADSAALVEGASRRLADRAGLPAGTVAVQSVVAGSSGVARAGAHTTTWTGIVRERTMVMITSHGAQSEVTPVWQSLSAN